ncbi:ATP-binding protein [Nostoc sp. MG11]|uniref:ATP-binding protein n=1 Tax=Nostoc sp. MG11 TaxID=2721166 RepID=UPI001866FEB5|nr:SbcC/MukB-like Walker B domain-containing protein [Nostoc sp. MG11]
MQILLPIEQNGDSDSHTLAGFRLQRFEVLNWGTFDQRPWVLNLVGEMALLTGANGSGKSTLVDGLLTLLVSNKRRNYNQASSATGKKERDEKSYVQGAYGRTRAEDSYGSKSKLLREKGKLSVLLAYFHDVVSKQKVSLVQVLWMHEGAVKKFFVIANDELAIASHFAQVNHISDLKKRLKAMGAETFEEFSKYSEQFRKRLGLQSEKALDLFSQTVSIKEIGGLNDFVRNHMLEKTDVKTKIQELQESYENLTVSHDAIQKARKQLEALIPLTEEAEKFTQLKQSIANLQQLQDVAPAYFAQRKFELLESELRTIEQKLTQAQHFLAESDRLLEDLRQQEQQLIVAINQDSIGQRLRELKREIEQRHKQVSSKQLKAEEYDRLAQSLNLPKYNDNTTFYANQARAQEEIKCEIEAALQNLEAQRDEQITQRNDLRKQQVELNSELKSLRQRKSQIPQNNLEIRDRLIHDLNLDEADLPFVGELLQVRAEEREWEGAIERLLKGFGLCVLVLEQHYLSVNAYVHKTHLQGRLVYYRVTPSAPNPTQRALNSQQVPYKLEIKRDNETFYHWLHDQLVRQFSYGCCNTVEQFQHETRAITSTGLIKHGGERHEKDDRYQIGDRRHYILGWNNANKIKAIETELHQVNQQLTRVEKQVEALKQQRSQREKQKSWLQDFMNFQDFAEIDWRSTELERLKLLEQKQQLEASSDRLKQLEAQIQETQQEIQRVSSEQKSLSEEIGTLKGKQQSAEKDKSRCVEKFSQVSPQLLETFTTQMASKLKRHSLTLDTIHESEEKIRDSLSEKIKQENTKQSSCQNAIITRMSNFRNSFPEVTADIGTTLESLEEYLKLKEKIEHDDLPRHERRFREMMTEKIIIAVSMFKSSLEKQEEEIRQSIDNLNESLRQINYTESTYIELHCEASRNQEIRDFKNDLKVCLGDVTRQSTEDNEERFKNIQARLIKRFKEEERWTSLVTDVRNWLDFSVSERYSSDDTEKEHHTDSSGKSGGQKVKLAYTILASAIAYQFGLNQDDIKSKSFRFVVIDEAFSKSDDNNARYAMELFKNLNLQLLVVTPKDKINVIESYISNLHFVSNTSEGNYSSITPISIEGYQQKRQLVLSKSRDQSLSNQAEG